MKLFLSPVDVWLFRDGRPFDAGDDHYARSLFPPYPSVLQGAIRSHHLVVNGVDLRDKKAIKATVGTADDYGSLRVRGPFIACYSNGKLTRYFPAPADAARCDDEHLKTIDPQPASRRKVVTSADDQLPSLFFPHDVKPDKRELGGWLTEKQLKQCLQGNKVKPIHATELFTFEHRYGIKIKSENRATEEGMLYAAEFVRPCDGVGLYVQVEGYDDWPKSGVMRIGGEGHAARFETVDAPDWPAPPDTLPTRFKLYFASPAYFHKGWRPETWDKFFDGKVELKAVAINRYESRGGFDWASGGQKPAQRFVPAGSVYCFECSGTVHLHKDLTQNAITDLGAEIGFGQVWIEKWQ